MRSNVFQLFARNCAWVLILTLLIAACGNSGDSNNLPPILYLGPDEFGNSQVTVANIGGEPQRITEAEAGVYDFAVAPNGKTVSYSTTAVDGSNEIWVSDVNGRNPEKILRCVQAECSRPVWANDSRRIAFEKRPIGADGRTQSSYLWWLDSETGETLPLFEGQQERGSGISFAPDGRWLSYVSPEDEGVFITNLDEGSTSFAAGEIGVPAAWDPSSQRIIVPNLNLLIIHGEDGEDHIEHGHEYESATHLYSMDVTGENTLNISGDLNVEDSVPAWSPDGEWIAFGRRYPGTSAGRQLWLMRADGSEQRVLVDDASISYGPPAWSPDGQHLMFQQFRMDNDDGYPNIGLLDLETGQVVELAGEGMQPVWLVGEDGS